MSSKSFPTAIVAVLLALSVSIPDVAYAKRSGSSSKSYSSGGSSRTTTVRGYTKKNGTYVAPHRRTAPNKTQRDNWTSKPNTNPDNGKRGTKNPDH